MGRTVTTAKERRVYLDRVNEKYRQHLPDHCGGLARKEVSQVSNIAFGIVVFPFSWRLGVWSRPKKDILSIGPIRFVLYKDPGEWKVEAERGSQGNVAVISKRANVLKNNMSLRTVKRLLRYMQN